MSWLLAFGNQPAKSLLATVPEVLGPVESCDKGCIALSDLSTLYNDFFFLNFNFWYSN